MNTPFYFLAEWSVDKKRTWSGTVWGVYSALSKRMNVVDIDISRKSFVDRVVKKIINKLLGFDLGLYSIFANRLILNKFLKQNGVVFQFAEFAKNSKKFRTYIYQDLSVDYIDYIRQHSTSACRYAAYNNVSKKILEKRKFMQNNYYRSCSGIFTMGNWLAKDVVERTGIPASKVHVVGGGINLDKESIDYSQKEGNKFFFVGRDYLRKGGDLVYEAFCLLKHRRPEIELYFAGPKENPFPNAVDGFHFMGDCDKPVLTGLFNKCDVFVMPSHFEAYGLVFIEALSFGLPCIGRNAYEMPYFIENDVVGYLVDNYDVEGLANKMLMALDNKEMKKNVMARKDFYLKEYSWETVADKICSVINKEN